MMTGEATVSIDMQNYSVKPNTIVFFSIPTASSAR